MLNYWVNIMRKTGLRYLWLSLVVFCIDRMSKIAVGHVLAAVSKVKILPYLDLVLTYNSGAAFGLLAFQAWWPNVLFIVIAVIIIAGLGYNLYHNSAALVSRNCAIALILGGALGNLFDRLYYNHVIDFIGFHAHNWYWPIFNVADCAISGGAMVLCIHLLVKEGE